MLALKGCLLQKLSLHLPSSDISFQQMLQQIPVETFLYMYIWSIQMQSKFKNLNLQISAKDLKA